MNSLEARALMHAHAVMQVESGYLAVRVTPITDWRSIAEHLFGTDAG